MKNIYFVAKEIIAMCNDKGPACKIIRVSMMACGDVDIIIYNLIIIMHVIIIHKFCKRVIGKEYDRYIVILI